MVKQSTVKTTMSMANSFMYFRNGSSFIGKGYNTTKENSGSSFLSRILIILIALFCISQVTIADDNVPYAIWCSGNSTLYFTSAQETDAYTSGGTYNGQTITSVWSGNYVSNSGKYIPEWYSYTGSKVISVVFEDSFSSVKPQSCYCWFSQMTNLRTIRGISNLNTSAVTNMGSMFYGCANLTSLDLSGFETSNVTDMSGMFSGCEKMQNVIFSSKFVTSNVTSMNSMFRLCVKLSSIDLSCFDTSNVTDMFSMFYNCSSLTSLNLSSFDTSNVTNMSMMFSFCSVLNNLDLSTFNTAKVTSMSDMFYFCNSLKTLNVSNFNTEQVTTMYRMFYGCEVLESLDLSSFNAKNVTTLSSMFQYCYDLASLDISNFNTKNVKNFYQMFHNCNSLTNLDLSSFDTSSATNMSEMFFACNSLTEITFSDNFNTENVTNMSKMFYNCIDLTSLDLSGFNTGNVTDMSLMFNNCKALTSLDLSNFDAGNVTDMSNMFYYCSSLREITFSENFRTNKVKNMSSMFNGCSALTILDLTYFSTSYDCNIGNMFNECSSLTTIYCDNIWRVSSSSGMFSGCTNLVGGLGTVYAGYSTTGGSYAHPDGGTTNPGYFTSSLQLPFISLYGTGEAAESNEQTIGAYDRRKVNVTIYNSTLYKDGKWNTLCLPFDLPTLYGTSLEGAQSLMTLSNEGTNFSDGILTLNFESATGIKAGKPYLIKWASDEDIEELVINNVTFRNVPTDDKKVETEYVDFVGNLAPMSFTSADNTILYLGDNNTLYYPSPAEGTSMQIGAFRAYFHLKGITAGGSTSSSIKAFHLNFGDEENCITEIKSNEQAVTGWFTLEGIRVFDKPTKKGIYIKEGRKFLIK